MRACDIKAGCSDKCLRLCSTHPVKTVKTSTSFTRRGVKHIHHFEIPGVPCKDGIKSSSSLSSNMSKGLGADRALLRLLKEETEVVSNDSIGIEFQKYMQVHSPSSLHYTNESILKERGMSKTTQNKEHPNNSNQVKHLSHTIK